MNCPMCDSGDLKVTNVRNKEHKTWRIRHCLNCGENFTTYEINIGILVSLFEDVFPVEINNQITNILNKEYPTKAKIKEIQY